MLATARKRSKKPRAVGASLWSAIGGGEMGASAGDPSGSAGVPLGLSKVHNSTVTEREGDFRIVSADGGNVVEVVRVGRKKCGAVTKKRGTCKGFTRGSRRRLMVAVQQLDRRRVCRVFFVTLTVPAGSADWRRIETFRRAYVERFKREWGRRAFVVWKKEPQPDNGTPHLHLLVFWVTPPPNWREFVDWNDPAWGEVTGNPLAHVACNVKWLNGWGGVAFYVAKYFGKLVEGIEGETGRIWGTFNNAVRPVTLSTQVLSEVEGVRVVRALRKLQEKKRRRWLAKSEGRWFRVRRERGRSVEDRVQQFREVGVPVRLVKHRVTYTRTVPVWVEVEDKKGRKHVEKRSEVEGGDEKVSCVSSIHFIASSEVDRLVAFVRKRVEADKKFSASLPF